MAEMKDRWLSVDYIGKYLGSARTRYKWIDKQEIPGHRMGPICKFKKDEVDEW